MKAILEITFDNSEEFYGFMEKFNRPIEAKVKTIIQPDVFYPDIKELEANELINEINWQQRAENWKKEFLRIESEKRDLEDIVYNKNCFFTAKIQGHNGIITGNFNKLYGPNVLVGHNDIQQYYDTTTIETINSVYNKHEPKHETTPNPVTELIKAVGSIGKKKKEYVPMDKFIEWCIISKVRNPKQLCQSKRPDGITSTPNKIYQGFSWSMVTGGRVKIDVPEQATEQAAEQAAEKVAEQAAEKVAEQVPVSKIDPRTGKLIDEPNLNG